MTEGNRKLNARIMQAFTDAEEARIRLLGVLAVLVADGIISSGRVRELRGAEGRALSDLLPETLVEGEILRTPSDKGIGGLPREGQRRRKGGPPNAEPRRP